MESTRSAEFSWKSTPFLCRRAEIHHLMSALTASSMKTDLELVVEVRLLVARIRCVSDLPALTTEAA